MKNDDPVIAGWHASTHNGNGDRGEWIDYQGCISEDGSGYRGYADPDPKYDLAPLLARRFSAICFIREMEKYWNDQGTTTHIDIDLNDVGFEEAAFETP